MEKYNPITKGWLIYLGNDTYQTLFIDEIISNDYIKKYNINNFPIEEHLINLTNVINKVYQPICLNFGCKIPLKLSYISEEYNQHLNVFQSNEMLNGYGLNIDTKGVLSNINNRKIFEFIKKNTLFNKLIWYLGNDQQPDNIFVSFIQDNNKNEVLRLRNVGSKYEKFDIQPIVFNGFNS